VDCGAERTRPVLRKHSSSFVAIILFTDVFDGIEMVLLDSVVAWYLSCDVLVILHFSCKIHIFHILFSDDGDFVGISAELYFKTTYYNNENHFDICDDKQTEVMWVYKN